MAIRVQLQDEGLGIALVLHVSGSYSPDVLDDITARCSLLYRTALTDKINAVPVGVDGDSDEG